MARNEKLICNKIPEIIRAQGGEPVVRVADAGEYRELLRAKLVEETQADDDFLERDACPGLGQSALRRRRSLQAVISTWCRSAPSLGR